MLPDCFGFPASLPTILAHSGVKGFSTQKLVWGSSADAGGPESLREDAGRHAVQRGCLGGTGWRERAGRSEPRQLWRRDRHRSQQTAASRAAERRAPGRSEEAPDRCNRNWRQAQRSGQPFDQKDIQEYMALQSQQEGSPRHSTIGNWSDIRTTGPRASSRTAKSVAYSRTITITVRATSAGLRMRNL